MSEETESTAIADPNAPAEIHVDVGGLLDEKYVDGEVGEVGEPEKVPASKTALMLDNWSVRRGKEMLESSELLQQAIGDREDGDLIAADMFAVAWEPEPELAAVCEDQPRSNYFRQLMQTPSYRELHVQTQFSDVASEIAAASFAKGYEAVAAIVPSGKKIKDEAKALQVATKAAKEATQQVSDAKSMADGLGCSIGGDPSQRSQALSAEEIAHLFSKVRDNYTLQQIMRLAGRYRRLAQSRQRTKVVHGRDEVCGVEPTDEIQRLLPAELAYLDIPALEVDFLRRLIEGSTMGYEFRALEGEARGPIVVMVDESGSMGGDCIAHAKAIALAMAWIARHQKRYCCLSSFSDGPGGVFFPMPNGESEPAALLDWLGGFIGGGTDLTMLCDELPKHWDGLGCTDGKTDIIVITDCGLGCDDERRDKFNEWRRSKNARVETVVIGRDAGQMEKISDQIHLVENLGVEVEAVGDLMDI